MGWKLTNSAFDCYAHLHCTPLPSRLLWHSCEFIKQRAKPINKNSCKKVEPFSESSWHVKTEFQSKKRQKKIKKNFSFLSDQFFFFPPATPCLFFIWCFVHLLIFFKRRAKVRLWLGGSSDCGSWPHPSPQKKKKQKLFSPSFLL